MLPYDCANHRVLIVGLGNELMGDDGVGVHAARELLDDPPVGVRVVEVGTRVLHAQHLLEDADVVIAIDAVRAGGTPGSIYRFGAEDAELHKYCSLHDMGIVGLLQTMPESSRPCVVILGVEPETIACTMQLSPAVSSALRRLVRAVREIAENLRINGLAGLCEDRLRVRNSK